MQSGQPESNKDKENCSNSLTYIPLPLSLILQLPPLQLQNSPSASGTLRTLSSPLLPLPFFVPLPGQKR